MKRSIAAILLLALALSLTGCVIDFSKPVRDDREIVKTKYGDEFKVCVYVTNMSAYKTILNVIDVGHEVSLMRIRIEGLPNPNDYYDAIAEACLTEIISDYREGDTRGYRFNWGTIYTFDGGANFSCVAMHEYETRALEETEVGPLLSKMGIRLFGGRPYKPESVLGRSLLSIMEEYVCFDETVYDVDDTGREIVKEGRYHLKKARSKNEERIDLVIVFENDIATEAYITNALSD
ncbi:MAG: hypothetical protein IKS88_04405 [Clostridia bacterium]|nr:hypothetical protein [Clostridia bacterium]